MFEYVLALSRARADLVRCLQEPMTKARPSILSASFRSHPPLLCTCGWLTRSGTGPDHRRGRFFHLPAIARC